MDEPDSPVSSQDTIGEVEATDAQTQLLLQDCFANLRALQLRVTGDCMVPALRPGDLVGIVSAQDRPPRLGDIVLFRHPHGLRLHRLVYGLPRHGTWRRFKADRAAHWDPPVPASSVVGTVVAIEAAHGTRPAPRRFSAVITSLLRAFLRGPFSWAGVLHHGHGACSLSLK
jgi:hypothetical protein